MYSKLALFSLAILAAARPNDSPPTTTTVTVTTTAPAPTQTSQCNTGSNAECCNNVGAANSAPIAALLALIGVPVGSITGIVGLGCTSILGGSCNQQAVCCTGNKFNGLVNVGCSPIAL